MKLAEIRLKSNEELKAQLSDTRHEYMNLRFQVVTGQLTDTSRLKQTRRLIATLETILRERELAASREGAK
ncbi:LSU ribosomal protein L29P [Longilinea arvoryzae]|uniref:Large ribosomal subunit protein uL29 n=1 Tax=Longilinea arvoryzae TaxID=360412 RepID=A0A0S7BM73_9CHLR|nr:50S ribosomal protein L29 [Longilinea arvoryzae]GAP15314.1 LSU ribosomal protein L29P [Longilinea arvoryzae]